MGPQFERRFFTFFYDLLTPPDLKNPKFGTGSALFEFTPGQLSSIRPPTPEFGGFGGESDGYNPFPTPGNWLVLRSGQWGHPQGSKSGRFSTNIDGPGVFMGSIQPQ